MRRASSHVNVGFRCYTNHALDQFLEQLVEDGVDQLIRLGSRSKSTILQPLNIRAVSQRIQRTRTEKDNLWIYRRRLTDDADEADALLKAMKHADTWQSIEAYLQTHHPRHYSELFGEHNAQWDTAKTRKKDIIQRWLRKGPAASNGAFTERPLSIRSLQQSTLSELSRPERAMLHDRWVEDIRNDIIWKLGRSIETYSSAADAYDRCRLEIDLRCLEQAKVVGVTTSGLARNIDILRRLRAKTLICEEAGEVLEAHMLTALLPSLEHVILIGDHQQLRPRFQNYDLSIENPIGDKFGLDVSLFERLVRQENSGRSIAFSSLEIQRRMHPSISRLIRDTIYPKLQDDQSVSEYPIVNGVRTRLYWLDHQEQEARAGSQQSNYRSHWNDHEVELTAAFVSHLIRQGTYRSEDIVILTPYVEQLRRIQTRLSNAFEILVDERDLEELGMGDNSDLLSPVRRAVPRKTTLFEQLRVATVDNFQVCVQAYNSLKRLTLENRVKKQRS